MDTNQYSNILKAIGNNGNNGLSTQQQADNYSAFSKMMNEGVYIPDLIKKIDTLETKVQELEKGNKQSPVDLDLFAVMESAVKDDPEVKSARKRLADEKSRVIAEMCMNDAGFKDASEQYRRAVNQAYVRQKESASDRGESVKVRDD